MDGPLHALVLRRARHLRPQGAHDLHLFLGETLRNENHHAIAAIDSDQRQADAGVPCRGLDDGAAGLKLPFSSARRMMPMAARSFTLPPGFRYSSLTKTIGGAGGRDSLELQERSFADELGDVVGNAQAGAIR